MLSVLLWMPLSGFAAGVRETFAPPPAPAAAAVDTPDTRVSQLRAKLAEAQTRFNRLHADFGTSTNLPPGATQAEAIEFSSLLKALIQTYQAHLDDLAAIETIRQRQQDFDYMAKTWTGFSEQPPYSILLVDDIRDTIQSFENKIRMAETAQAFAERIGSDAGTYMGTSEGTLRRLSEQLERQTDPALIVRLDWLRELEQTRNQTAAATVSSFETKRRKASEELSENRQRLTFAKRQLALADRQVRFTQADLDKAIDNLNRARTQLKADELAAYARLEASQKALAEARANLQKALQDPSQAIAAPSAIRQLQEVVDTRSTQNQAYSEIVTCMRQLLRGIDTEQQLWQIRFTIFGKHEAAELQTARKRLNLLSELILAAKPFFNQQITLTTSLIIEQQNALQNNADSNNDPVLARERLDAFHQQAETYRRVLEGLEKHERLVLRWKEALALDRETRSFTERVHDFFTGAAHVAASVWNFELFVVTDTLTVDGQKITGDRGITIGKICMAFLILLVGYWISRRTARGLERQVISKLKIEPNQANLIRRWTHVMLMVFVVIFSLVSVKIPLTIFAFAGGALAIGIGFGTQNLLKNFISGIIILFERPFRVGDVLDVSGQRGKITSIGIRSSILQLWDGTETLIPNSALLENNLTNWTYSNRTVRFTVTVAVAYGSDTRRVAQVLVEVADRHGLVQKDPKPIVLFTQFGDSTLTFDLLFWVDVLKCNAAQISSDLRHMIAGQFAEHGIVMAFPQRDVHLDTAKPLQVHLMPLPNTQAADEAPQQDTPEDAPSSR